MSDANTTRLAALCLALFTALWLTLPCPAQDDPFAPDSDDPPPAAGPADPSDPFSTSPAAPAAKPTAESGAAAATATPEDAVVIGVQRAAPSSPLELMRAVRVLVRIGRHDVAAPYLERFLAARGDDNVLAAVHRDMGSAFFMQLALDPKIQPTGQQAATAVMAAADRVARDPARLAATIGWLTDGSEARRAQAIVELRAAGAAAVAPLLRTLAEERADDATVRAALVEMGAAAIEPLIGALQTTDERQRIAVIEALGELRAARARPYLVRSYLSAESSAELRQAAELAFLKIGGPAPDAEAGAALLFRTANELFAGRIPLRPDENNRITLWRWDASKGESIPVIMTAGDASLQAACRLAFDLYSLRPEDPDAQRLFLITQLQAAKIVGGVDQPLPGGAGSTREAAGGFGVAMLKEVFLRALEERRLPAAAAAIEVLADIAGAELLQESNGADSVLVMAMKSPYRRLQLAAAEAIARIDPTSPYAGSSHFSRALGRLVRSAGERRVLIGLPNVHEGQSLAGLLLGLGYESDVGLTGAETFALATSPERDYEFVLLHDAVDHPDALELLQWLRRDPRTAPLPVALIAREHRLEEMRRIAEIDALTLAMPRLHDAQTALFQIDRLQGLLGRDYVTFDERLRAASWALDTLAKLAASAHNYAFYDLIAEQDALESALANPSLAERAAAALGSLATPQAQRALLAAASESSRPIKERQAAAAAFAAAVGRRRVLLTSEEILQQYDRYNASRNSDAATQEVLGALLDAIEAPSKTAAR